jgi:hypothetical protein
LGNFSFDELEGLTPCCGNGISPQTPAPIRFNRAPNHAALLQLQRALLLRIAALEIERPRIGLPFQSPARTFQPGAGNSAHKAGTSAPGSGPKLPWPTTFGVILVAPRELFMPGNHFGEEQPWICARTIPRLAATMTTIRPPEAPSGHPMQRRRFALRKRLPAFSGARNSRFATTQPFPPGSSIKRSCMTSWTLVRLRCGHRGAREHGNLA